jgi:glycosyltransferase involved in cell wall biosynthesis
MTTKKKLIIVVPAYNEAGRITETIKALKSELAKFDHVHSFVYVVNDGSVDDTQNLAKAAGADKILVHHVNLGLGAAVRTGLGAANHDGADMIVKFDADLQHDPADIRVLIQPVLDDEADVVYGNRFSRIEYKMPLVRSWGNKTFLFLMRKLTGWPLKDSQPGIFCIGKRYASVFHLPGDYNYTQQILLDAYLKNMRFAHVDVAFRKRTTGKSFISFKYPFRVLPQILMVMASAKPMKIFFPVGMFFLLLAAGVFAVELLQWMFFDAVKPVRSVNLVLGAGLFGVQTLFFGILAELIVMTRRSN